MESFLKKLKIRIYISVGLLAVFVVVGAIQAGQWAAGVEQVPSVVFLLGGYFLLPRRTLPKGFVPQKDSEEDAELVMRMRDLKHKLMYAQVVYFLIGVVVLIGFPKVF